MKDKIKELSLVRRAILITIITLISILSLLLTSSYAYLEEKESDTSKTVVNTSSCAGVVFTSSVETLNLIDSYPMSDNQGKKTEPMTLSLYNSCNSENSFDIYLVVNDTTTIANEYMKLYHNDITKRISTLNDGSLSDELILQYNQITKATIKDVYYLDTQVLEAKGEVDIDLNIWIDKDFTGNDASLIYDFGLVVTDN